MKESLFQVVLLPESQSFALFPWKGKSLKNCGFCCISKVTKVLYSSYICFLALLKDFL